MEPLPGARPGMGAHGLPHRGRRHSVGVVGLPAHLDRARQLRADLPRQVHLWVNAAEGHTYTDAEAAEWTALDPLFGYSRHPHRGAGPPCRTGASVISVDGDGTVRRCHFVAAELGNLYDGSYRAALRPRPCPLAVCDCHIGYVHLESLPCTTCSRAVCGNTSRRRPRRSVRGRSVTLFPPRSPWS